MIPSIVLLTLVSVVTAHNWIFSTARARGVASTVSPCQKKRGVVPHVQIAKNQKFAIEWSTGHGDPSANYAYTFLALVKSKDERYLKTLAANRREILDEYFENAPSSQKTMPAVDFRKVHRKIPSSGVGVLDNGPTRDFFARELRTGMPGFVEPTPPVETKGVHTVTVEYKASSSNSDRYVAYTNEKWPWLVGAWRYRAPFHQPAELDYAQFEIPNNPDEKESYVMWWNWRAYNDCVDIDYLGATVPAPIANPYGVPEIERKLQRIDHCYFPDYTRIVSRCHEVVGQQGIRHLHREMTGNVPGRYFAGGLIMAPLELPDTVNPDTVNPELAEELIPWGVTSTRDKRNSEVPEFTPCDRAQFAHVTDPKKALVAFAVSTREPSDTQDVYEIVTDPSSPWFYSTCFLPVQHVQFDSLPPPPTQLDPEWRQGDRCLSCDDAWNNSFLVRNDVVWNVANTCINCDLEFDRSAAPVTAATDLTVPGPVLTNPQQGRACDGWGTRKCNPTPGAAQVQCELYRNSDNTDTCEEDRSNWSCLKALTFVGVDPYFITLQECAELAKNDPECQKEVVFNPNGSRNYRGPSCQCWLSRSCCKDCVLTNYDEATTFTLVK